MNLFYIDVFRDAIHITEIRTGEGKAKRLKSLKGTMQEMVSQTVDLIWEKKPEKVVIENIGMGYAFRIELSHSLVLEADGTVNYTEKT